MFKLEQSSSFSDDADIAGRAATATTWASSSRGDNCDEFDNDDDDDNDGNDVEFFHKIANDRPTPSSTAVAAATVATVDDSGGSQQSEKKLLISFVLMVIVGTGNKIFQKLQAIPMYNYPNWMNLIQKRVRHVVASVSHPSRRPLFSFHVF